MKKLFYSVSLLLCASLTSIVLNSCEDEPTQDSYIEGVSLRTAALALTVGQSDFLEPSANWVGDIEFDIILTSSNPSVATVTNGGDVTAISPGTATITATAGDKTATCVVTVATIPVTDISLDRNALDTWVSGNETLVATVTPEDATDQTIIWTSSNNAVATVDGVGKLTVITAGTATITAKAGDKTATCTVTAKTIPTHGVLIKNVVWAKYTMTEENGTMILSEGSSMFYQWNRIKAWGITGDVTGWVNTAQEGTEWETANDPCPMGWRIPTKEQLLSLASSGRNVETVDGVAGVRFGSGDNSIFLAATGNRNYQSGTLRDQGTWGYYWGRTGAGVMQSVSLVFTTTGQVSVENRSDDYIRASGRCVRCVAE